jgi:hypothetical protein
MKEVTTFNVETVTTVGEVAGYLGLRPSSGLSKWAAIGVSTKTQSSDGP